MNLQDKIYHPDEAQFHLDLRKYKEDIEKYCTDLVAEAKKNAAKIHEDAYNTALAKIHEEQTELIQQNQNKVFSTLEQMHKHVYHLLSFMIVKLGSEGLVADRVYGLLKKELEKFKNDQAKMSIWAHSESLPQIRTLILEDYGHIEHLFHFFERNTLQLDECILETQYVVARIHFEKALKKLKEILEQHFGVLHGR